MGSASADNIKQWKFPDGNFIQNLTGHNAILNCLALNSDGVLVSGGRFDVEVCPEIDCDFRESRRQGWKEYFPFWDHN